MGLMSRKQHFPTNPTPSWSASSPAASLSSSPRPFSGSSLAERRPPGEGKLLPGLGCYIEYFRGSQFAASVGMSRCHLRFSRCNVPGQTTLGIAVRASLQVSIFGSLCPCPNIRCTPPANPSVVAQSFLTIKTQSYRQSQKQAKWGI